MHLFIPVSGCISIPSINTTDKVEQKANPEELTGENPYLNPSFSVPEHLNEWFQQGIKALDAESYQEAEAWFLKIIESDPTLSGALVNLAIVYMHQEKIDKAEHTYKQAITANTKNIYARNQLAYLYRTLGEFDEAEKQYLEATQIWPAFSNAWLNLGILYDLYLFEPEKAMNCYKKYQEIQEKPDIQIQRWVKDLEMRHPDEFK